MAFFIGLFLTFFPEVVLLATLQLDFMLPMQVVIFFVVACIAGLIFAMFVGQKYYQEWESRILRAFSRVAIGTIAFCMTLPFVLTLGTILLFRFLPMNTAVFFIQNS
jgi:hypothetical protein